MELPFVGRETELTELTGLLHDVRSTGGRATAIIEAGAGEGKSTLISRLAASARGFTTLRAQADELGPTRLLDELRSALAEDGALIEGLEHLATDGEVLVVLEDLHWADAHTLAMLLRLHADSEFLPVAFCLTLRSLPRSPELNAFLERLSSAGSHWVRLPPLTDDEVERLAAAVLGSAPSARLLDWLGRASGNPLYVGELLSAATDTVAALTDAFPPLPPTLADAILRRLRAMGDDARNVLTVGAVLGPDFRPDDLAALLGRPLVDLAGHLRDAVHAGILTEDGDRLTFRHQVIHDVIYADVPGPVRGSLHREAALVLERRPRPDARLVQHLVRATVGEDAASVRWLVDAALRAAEALPLSSLPVIDRASRMLDAGDPRHLALTVSSLIPTLISGDTQGAIDLARGTLSEDLSVDQRRRAVSALLASLQHAGRFAEVRTVSMPILNDPSATDEMRAMVGQRLAWTEHMEGNVEAAGTIAEQVLELPGTGSHPLMHMTAVLALVARGNLDEAFARARMIVSADARHTALGIASMEADAPGAAAALQASIDAIEQEPGWSAMIYGVLAFHALTHGRLEDSIEHVESALTVADGGWWPEFHFVRAVRARVFLHQGQPDDAAGDLAQAVLERAPTQQGLLHDLTTWVEGCVAEANGDAPAALDRFADAWRSAARRRYYYAWRLVAPDLVRLAVACGRPEVGREVTDEFDRTTPPTHIASADACVRRCRGLLAGDAEQLIAAALRYDEGPRVLDAAATRVEAAALMQRRDPARRNLLEHALAAYEAVGADGDMATVTTMLGRARRHPSRPTTGWESLTPAQLAVARKVAAGLSNPQIAAELFLSRYTVATHLKHVFAKLGVASRAELAGETVRQLG